MADETLTQRLAALAKKATDSDLTDGGRYFEDSCDDLTKCGHGDTGEYQHTPDGELIEALWNAYRNHQLVERALPSFETAWGRYIANGYHYGGDALENVEFGYRIAQEELAALAKARGEA